MTSTDGEEIQVQELRKRNIFGGQTFIFFSFTLYRLVSPIVSPGKLYLLFQVISKLLSCHFCFTLRVSRTITYTFQKVPIRYWSTAYYGHYQYRLMLTRLSIRSWKFSKLGNSLPHCVGTNL